MDKIIYAESSITYRPVENYELYQFKKIGHLHRIRKRRISPFSYRKKLFSSNCRPFIMMANGLQTKVAKGSQHENMFWHVKDSIFSPGNCYYFDTPEEAEQIFKIRYPFYLKNNWYKKTAQYRTKNDDDDEITENDVTVIR